MVVLTKKAGLEGTAIIASDMHDDLIDLGVDEEILARAKDFYKMVSVVREALALASRGLASAMHDPTEGGVLGGLLEVAAASNNRVRLYRDSVPFARETLVICRYLSIDPLKLISSGSLIAVVKPENIDYALKILKGMGVEATVIGEIVEGSPAVEIVDSKGRVIDVVDSWVQDEIYRIIS
jgi:hydrogenase maturation factor